MSRPNRYPYTKSQWEEEVSIFFEEIGSMYNFYKSLERNEFE